MKGAVNFFCNRYLGRGLENLDGCLLTLGVLKAGFIPCVVVGRQTFPLVLTDIKPECRGFSSDKKRYYKALLYLGCHPSKPKEGRLWPASLCGPLMDYLNSFRLFLATCSLAWPLPCCNIWGLSKNGVKRQLPIGSREGMINITFNIDPSSNHCSPSSLLPPYSSCHPLSRYYNCPLTDLLASPFNPYSPFSTE